jgi:hypothetical protein
MFVESELTSLLVSFIAKLMCLSQLRVFCNENRIRQTYCKPSVSINVVLSSVTITVCVYCIWCHAGGNAAVSQSSSGEMTSESLLWTYVVQLSAILRAIHGHGLACRVMDPTKILLTDKTRLVFSAVQVKFLIFLLFTPRREIIAIQF